MAVIRASDRVNPNRVVGGVQRASDRFPVVSTTLWTPAQITTAGWWDATIEPANVGGLISQWDDQSGNNRHHVQTETAFQMSYEANNALHGGPAVVRGINDRWGNAGTFNVRHIFMLLTYMDGTPTTFNAITTFIATPNTDTGGNPRVMANQGASGFFAGSEPISWRKNGEVKAVSDPVLPVNKDILHLEVNRTGANSILNNETSAFTRGWDGVVSEIVLVGQAMTLSQIQIMEGYYSHKWGAPLISGHPYENAAPTV